MQFKRSLSAKGVIQTACFVGLLLLCYYVVNNRANREWYALYRLQCDRSLLPEYAASWVEWNGWCAEKSALDSYVQTQDGKAAILYFMVKDWIASEMMRGNDFVLNGRTALLIPCWDKDNPKLVRELFCCSEMLDGSVHSIGFMWTFNRSNAPCTGIVWLLPELLGVQVTLPEYPGFNFRIETLKQGTASSDGALRCAPDAELPAECVCVIRRNGATKS